MARRANTYDVIVAGVGAMGAAACWHLARRGLRVLGLEQFGIPHARGSSHGYSRAIRLSYYEHLDYVPLLKRAWNLWRDLEAESGQTLLHATGGLYLGPPRSELIEGSLRAACEHGLTHELLTRAEIAERFPQFGGAPNDFVALFEKQAGFLRPEAAVAAFAARALRSGADLRGHEPVTDWQVTSDGVTVTTGPRGDTYQAGHLIVCGGAWSERLVRDLGVSLTVTRQVMGWVWPPQSPEQFDLAAGFPTWAIHDPASDSLFYGFPMLPDNPGFKVARHRPGPPTDPDNVPRDVLPGDEDDFRPGLAYFPSVSGGNTLAVRVCLYVNSPDGHFIVDRHPAHPAHVTLACGFSGHGFKFAPVIGETLADLATNGTTDLPVGFLSLSRFARP